MGHNGMETRISLKLNIRILRVGANLLNLS